MASVASAAAAMAAVASVVPAAVAAVVTAATAAAVTPAAAADFLADEALGRLHRLGAALDHDALLSRALGSSFVNLSNFENRICAFRKFYLQEPTWQWAPDWLQMFLMVSPPFPITSPTLLLGTAMVSVTS
jgi:hypothetical protein